MSIINNHGQNGVCKRGHINISRVAFARAAGSPKRGYAIENPYPIFVAVGDNGTS